MKKLLSSSIIALTLTSGFMAPSYASNTLTVAEAKTLQFMHEEEKLAQDVYLTLYKKWNVQAFSNIAGAEQRHQNRLKRLLDQYNIPSTIQSSQVGIFTNPELATMYKQLTTQGLSSLEAALKVGGMIEELDIMDLQKAIAESSRADVDQTYQHLMRGSRNHLRAFARQYKQRLGVTYKAQLMPEDEVNAIISSEPERGGAQGKHGKGHSLSQNKRHRMEQGDCQHQS